MQRNLLGILVLLGSCTLLIPDPVSAQADLPEPSGSSQSGIPAEEEGKGWLSRLLDRHFGNTRQSGEDLVGRALETVGRYARHRGAQIEVVLVHQVASFEQDWNAERSYSQRVLDNLTNPLQTYTRSRIIRQYLLFDPQTPLDPFALADSERLLRNLAFISDVRIVVVPLTGATGSVAVIVETRDRWPIGATGKIKDENRIDASLFSTNVFGIGLRFDHKLIYHDDLRPNWGYRGILRKENIGGHFLDLQLEFEDSWSVLRRQVILERRLVHPAIRVVGGGTIAETDDRDNEDVPRQVTHGNLWLGRVFKLGDGDPLRNSARPLLVPAAGVSFSEFTRRPNVRADTNRTYHNRRLLLAGITYQRFKNYQTSYLFRMGETEDVRSGFVLKGTGGYEISEFAERTCLFLETAYVSVANQGNLFFMRVGWGGYYRSHRYEEGVLQVGLGYIAPLQSLGSFKSRTSLQIRYTQGFDRFPESQLELGDRTGVRGMENERIEGQQRLVASLESRLFTSWSVFGFRTMVFGFADTGVVAAQKSSPVRERFYSSAGIGLRVHNPDLVFPELQVRCAFLNDLDAGGLLVAVDLGNVAVSRFELPGVKPGTVAYD